MGAKRMRTSRQQLIEEPATLADRTANGAGADAEPARELALEEGYRQGIEAAAKLIECGCKALLHGKGECQFPGNCSLEDAAAIRALGTSCEQLNKAVSNVQDQQENEPGAHGERERVLEEAAHNAAIYLATGFISCPRCGEDVETKNTDAQYTLRAALSSPDHADVGKVEGDGWLPIESAPKDGTRILAAGMKNGPAVLIVSYGRSGPYNRSTKQYAAGWSHIPGHLLEPTHWRPLPTPPSSEVA